MLIALENCKGKLGDKRLIPGKFWKTTFHTAVRWHSFTSEVHPVEVQNQVAFHGLFCIQGMTGWIIFVILEEPGEKGYSSALGRVGVRGHTHTPQKAISIGHFIPITGEEVETANHRKGRRYTGKSGDLSSSCSAGH